MVFAVAAAGKLADRSGTRRAMGDFHVPPALRGPAAVLLPIAELTCSVALIVPATSRLGGIAALLLLLAFAAGIGVAMWRGEAPDCHCFGQVGSAPAGRGTLIRNAMLALAAGLVVARGSGAPLDHWLVSAHAADVVAAFAVISLAGLVAFTARLWLDRRTLSRKLERLRSSTAAFPPGLPIGARAPGFALEDLTGATVTLDQLLALGRPVALAFVSVDCGPCAAMIRDIARWQQSLADRLTIALPSSGSARTIGGFVAGIGLARVLLDQDSEVFDAYRAIGTPSVVIIGADGRIASELRSTHAIMEAMIRRDLTSEAIPRSPDGASSAETLHVVEARTRSEPHHV